MAKLELKITTKKTAWYYVLMAFILLGVRIPKGMNSKVFMKAYCNGKEWFTYEIGDYLERDIDVAG